MLVLVNASLARFLDLTGLDLLSTEHRKDEWTRKKIYVSRIDLVVCKSNRSCGCDKLTRVVKIAMTRMRD